MRYRVYYRSEYRDKESIIINEDFDAIGDNDARKIAKTIVNERNEENKTQIETLSLIKVVRIDQEEKPEKLTPI